MAWNNLHSRIFAVSGRLRVIVGIGLVAIVVLSFTVLKEPAAFNGFFGGGRSQSGCVGPSEVSISTAASLNCLGNDTVYYVGCNGKLVRVEVKVSRFADASTRRKMLLLLPGWNYADTQWCTRTRVCDEALKRGYDVLMVEMGKSVYMDSLYPQMRADYRAHPTRTWLWDSVLQPLQLRGYCTDKRIQEDPINTSNGKVYYKSLRLPIPSFVLGLSTGARGALLLALEHPEAFKGCGGLSGDYNPLLMKSDNLMINCLGRYEAFPWRWQGSNNIVLRADALKVPVFLAHGTSDKVVPWEQTESLVKAIESSPSCKLQSSEFSKSNKNVGFIRSSFVKNAGHDYVFWNEAGLKALDYFDALLSD